MPSHPRDRRLLGLGAALALLVVASLASGFAEEEKPKVPPLEEETTAEKEVREKNLEFLNEQRRKTGAAGIPWRDDYLKGARLHCRYLLMNFSILDLMREGAHLATEDTKNPYYTYEGYNAARFSRITYGYRRMREIDDDPSLVTRFSLATLAHRYVALYPGQRGVGFAVQMSEEMWVAATRYATGSEIITGIKRRTELQPVIYPYDMHGSPTRFRKELPRPLPNLKDGDQVGLPISVSFYDLAPDQIKNPEISLYLRFPPEESAGEIPLYRSYDEREMVRMGRHGAGKPTEPIYVAEGYLPDTIWAIPREVLEPETWYLVASRCDIELRTQEEVQKATEQRNVRLLHDQTVRWWDHWFFKTGTEEFR